MTDNIVKGGIALKKIMLACCVAAIAGFLVLWTLLLPKAVRYTVKQGEESLSTEKGTIINDSADFSDNAGYILKLSDGKIVAEANGKTVMEIPVNADCLTQDDVEMLTHGVNVENALQLEALAQYLQS